MEECFWCEHRSRRDDHERALFSRASTPVLALYQFAYGLVNGYPLCCVLRFALTTLFNRGGSQAKIRGGIDDWPCGSFVACGIIHQGEWMGTLRPAWFRKGAKA